MKTLLLALCALTAFASAEPCQKERTLVGKNALVRDGSGRIAGTASTSGNSTTFRDGSGRIIGTSTVSGDSITYRDGSGRITGTACVRK
jgi:hypothetical protein